MLKKYLHSQETKLEPTSVQVKYLYILPENTG